MTYHIFVGYDEREHIPYLVTKHTLEKYAKVPIKVHKLNHRELREKKLFKRPWLVLPNGQYVDAIDGKPFSTQFSHSRFLISDYYYLCIKDRVEPFDLIMFVDCDFVFLRDIGELFEEIKTNDPDKAIWCVKHDFTPKESTKMDGMTQTNYNKKLWSAMFIMDPLHYKNAQTDFTELTNTALGSELHSFSWLKDEDIGDISERWHFVPDHSEQRYEKEHIKAIHYTHGGPWFPEMRECKYSEIWKSEYEDYLRSSLYNTKFDVNRFLDGE